MKRLFGQLIQIFSLFSISMVSTAIFAASDKITVDHNIPGEIILKAETCEELEKEVDAIRTWVKRFEINLTLAPGDYKKIPSVWKKDKTICEVNLSGKLPKFTERVLHEEPNCDGPNCFNSALVHSKILPSFRYVEGAEMSFWLSSPLCRERKLGEKMAPGDIIAIREKDFRGEIEEIHGFTHLTENLVLSKNGLSKYSPYSFYSPESVFKDYNVPEDCRRLYKTPANRECPTYANVFTCGPFPAKMVREADLTEKESESEKILPSKTFNFRKERRQVQGTGDFLCEMECQIEKMSWDKSSYGTYNPSPHKPEVFFETGLKSVIELAEERIVKIDEELAKLTGLFTSMFKHEKITRLKEVRFYWESLQQRARSTIHQKGFVPSSMFSKF